MNNKAQVVIGPTDTKPVIVALSALIIYGITGSAILFVITAILSTIILYFGIAKLRFHRNIRLRKKNNFLFVFKR